MSKNWFEWKNALYDAEDIDKGELAVGLYLWDKANKHHEAWPTVSKIARKTRYSRRQVQRIIKRLVDKGWITTRAWELPSGGESWRYILSLPSGEKAKEKWGLIQKDLQDQMSSHNYTAFFKPLWAEMDSADAQELTVVAPDEFLASWVKDNYRGLIEERARAHGITTISFTFHGESRE